MSKHATVTHTLTIPNSDKKIQVELSLVPSDELPETLHRNTNVAKVNIGGKEFFAIAGKTTAL